MMKLIVALLAMSPLAAAAQEASSENLSVDATLTRMQTLIHHAVETAAEGARLVALSVSEGTTPIDSLAESRGRAMLAQARQLITDVAAGDAMMHLHSLQLTEDQNDRMIEIHQLEQVATSYLNVTERLIASDDDAERDSAGR